MRSCWIFRQRLYIFLTLSLSAGLWNYCRSEDPAPEPSVGVEEHSKENAIVEKEKTVGEPMAASIMGIVEREIQAGLKSRGIADKFLTFQRYAGSRLNATAGHNSGSELTGIGRLKWYDHLLRNPLTAAAEAEQFTHYLHLAALDEHEGLGQLLSTARGKLDLSAREPHKAKPVANAQEALEAIKQALTDAQIAYAAALGPLSKSEIRELTTNLYPIFTSQNQVGHTLQDRGTGRRLCELIEKIDRGNMIAAAEALAPIADPVLLEQLKGLPDDGDVKVEGVTGRVVSRVETPSGTIVIGGKGANTYQLDKLRDVAVVIDLGGNDTYIEGTVSTARPILLVIDLEGNDTYKGTQPGIQGGAILGVSMLLDLADNDTYEAVDVAQGSCIAGVGILIDYAGDDRYRGLRRVQGQALGGVGILIDRAGKDDYRAAMWAQGFAGPLGFAVLDDISGNDHYYCGGRWRDSYPETPGYEGWGQGVGAGLRQVADGGIGVILEGGGDDVYEFDYLSHGGGYWCGLGFARDFGGDDKRLITRKAYDGSPRAETSFQRFGCGWGCHYSLGFCFDDAGDDVYEGTIMGSGMGWDCSVGVLCDFAGNDRYESTGGLTQGTGAQASLGILLDNDGDDVYLGYGQGYASSDISYHHLPECGGNFSFLLDYGGEDKYGCGAKNNSYNQRGSAGGFLIDRPRKDEANQTVAKSENQNAAQTESKSAAKTDNRTTTKRTSASKP
jgi:hypothetical protein